MKKKKRKSGGAVGSVFFIAITVILVVAIGSAAILSGMVSSWLKDLPDYESEGAFDVSQPTLIYSADDVLLARLFLENRETITLEQMSPFLLKATVAVEDERFYTHNGVDPIGIARSAVSILRGTRQGGSTLTQQYIRNTILRDEARDMTLKRKVREGYLAMKLEDKYSKDEILGMYLNTVYYGEGAYGAEAASQTFFAKHASELTIAEAALLAGLPQRPSGLSPYKFPEDSLKRRDQVLRRMIANDYITQAELDTALAEPINPKRASEPEGGIYQAHYFVAQVKKDLAQQFPKSVVFGGGLKVITTLDTRMQKDAEVAVASKIGEAGPEGALVAVDPKTGEVKAVVGGRDYNKNKFNMATQAHRQAGSAFKTFTLAAAINDGMSPSVMVDSSSPAIIPVKPPWTVSNSEGKGRGMITLAAGTYSSVNTVFARVVYALGPDKVVSMAKLLGIKTKLKPLASITLGAQNVTPLEMASAYATLANDGVYNEPTFIKSITGRDGKPVYEHKPNPKRVIDSEVAYATTKILQGVVSGGTATRARLGARPVAGKTGTSQLNRDVWFVGYTPQLSTAVWVGYPQEKTIIINGSRAFGGTVCAPIFQQFMTKALQDMPIEQFKTAENPKYDNSKYEIPQSKITDTVGMTAEEAIKALQGFTINIYQEYSDKPENIVIRQTLKGEVVELVISAGPDPATLPPKDPKPPGSTEPTGTARAQALPKSG